MAEAEIRLLRRGQANPAQSPVLPHKSGYGPQVKSENGDYDVARARALPDMHGYVDKNGDLLEFVQRLTALVQPAATAAANDCFAAVNFSSRMPAWGRQRQFGCSDC